MSQDRHLKAALIGIKTSLYAELDRIMESEMEGELTLEVGTTAREAILDAMVALDQAIKVLK